MNRLRTGSPPCRNVADIVSATRGLIAAPWNPG